MEPYAWPLAFFGAVLFTVSVGARIVWLVLKTSNDVRPDLETLKNEVTGLKLRLAQYIAPVDLKEELAALDSAIDTTRASIEKLLTRESAELIVASVNRLTADFVEVKTFVDAVKQDHALRTAVFGDADAPP